MSWPLSVFTNVLARKLKEFEGLGGLGGNDSLYAGVETSLVAAGGVLVDDALLDALVEHRDGGAVGCTKGLGIAFGDGLAQGAEASTELALVCPVDRGLGLCLTCALQRRNMICHSELSSLPETCRENFGMQASGWPQTQPDRSPAISKSRENRAQGQHKPA